MLSARRRRIVRRAATRVCPPDVRSRPALLDAIVGHVETTAASMSSIARRGFLVALDLEAMGRARRGRLGRSVRDVLVLAYYDQPEVKARLGYDPDAWTAAMTDRRLARSAQAIADHAALVVAPLPPPPLES